MTNKTIIQYPTIASLGLDDVVLGYDVGNNITVKIPVSNITSLVSGGSGGTVDASSVAAAGAVMTSYISGSTGFVKRNSTNSYSAVTVINPSEISGLAAVATVGTLSSLTDVSVTGVTTNQYLRYNGSVWSPVSISTSGGGGPTSLDELTDVSVSAATNNQVLTYRASDSTWIATSVSVTPVTVSLGSVQGFGAFGLAMASAATATSAQTLLNLGTLATVSTQASAATFLNLGTLATVSTAASARTFLAFTSIGTELVVNASTAASARSILGLGSLATQSNVSVAQVSGLATTTTDNAIVKFNGTGGFTQNSVMILESAGSVYGYQGKFTLIAGSSYTLVSSDTGKILSTTAAVTVSVVLPNSMQPGFNVTFIQKGAGVIQFTAGTSSTIEQRQSYTKSAGQYAAVGLIVSENSNGTAAHYLLSGDMS